MPRAVWLVPAVPGLDVSWADLVEWAIIMGRGTYGAVRLADMIGMGISLILRIIEEYNRLMKEEQNRGREE